MPLGLIVNTNLGALIAQRQLTLVNNILSRSIERLSSGLKIPRASDDPAGFGVAALMGATVSGINQAIANVSQSQSMIQTAEGLFDEITNFLNNIKALALHAANTGPNDISAIEQDQSQIRNALDAMFNIADTRKYGTKVLFDGSSGKTGFSDTGEVDFIRAGTKTITTQELDNLGATLTATVAVDVTRNWVRANVIAATAFGLTAGTAGGGSVSSILGQDETLVINGIAIELTAGMSIGDAILEINTFKTQTGVSAAASAGGIAGATLLRMDAINIGSAFTIAVQTGVNNATEFTSGLGGSNTITAGVDVAGVIRLKLGDGGTSSAVFTFSAEGDGQYLFARQTTQVINQTFAGVTFENRVVSLEGLKVFIATNGVTTVTSTALLQINQNPAQFQIGDGAGDRISQALLDMKPQVLGLSGELNAIDVRSVEGANHALKVVEEALRQVIEMRGALGSVQKQFLDSTLSNLLIYKENFLAAKSVIQDADFGEEMVSFTRAQILLQAGTAMLAQANLAPQSILQLLR